MEDPPPPPPAPGQQPESVDQYQAPPPPPPAGDSQSQMVSPYELLYTRQQPDPPQDAQAGKLQSAVDHPSGQHLVGTGFSQQAGQEQQQPVTQPANPEASQQPDTQMSQEQFSTMTEDEQSAYWKQWHEYEQYQQWQQQEQTRQWEAYYAAQAQPQYQAYDHQQYSQQTYQQQQQHLPYQQQQSLQQQQVRLSSMLICCFLFRCFDSAQQNAVVACRSGLNKPIHMLSISSMHSHPCNSNLNSSSSINSP